MLKQLVRMGNAFPCGLLIAISLLLCLFADGAWATHTRKPASTPDCASASNKNKPPCVVESPTGQVTVFWPNSARATLLAKSSKQIWWCGSTRPGLAWSKAISR